MSQKQLSNPQLRRVDAARERIMDFIDFVGDSEYWSGVANRLADIISYGTSDGMPWVEPTPPAIPKGHRLAVAGDERRTDCILFDAETRTWSLRWPNRKQAESGSDSFAAFDKEMFYAVPVDVTPTDREAIRRPWVMVRQSDDLSWMKASLYGVGGGSHPFSVILAGQTSFTAFQQARHLYPGE